MQVKKVTYGKYIFIIYISSVGCISNASAIFLITLNKGFFALSVSSSEIYVSLISAFYDNSLAVIPFFFLYTLIISPIILCSFQCMVLILWQKTEKTSARKM